MNNSLAQLLYGYFMGAVPKRYNAKTAVIGAATQTTGTGLSDITSGGTYTAVVDHVYQVKITVAAGTDKFQYNVDGGAFGNEVSLTGAAQNLANGVQVTFSATTGHTLNNVWTITVTAGVAISTTTLKSLQFNAAGTGAEVRIYNGSSTAGDLIYDNSSLAVTTSPLQLGYKVTSLYLVVYASGGYPDLIVGVS
jgi:hypothetical protein